MEKELDVVVFGATGVTGRRVVEYLTTRGAGRWAAAARDLGRLERLLAEQGVSAPEVIRADLTRPESLVAMARRARVVLNLVGPYAPQGRPVVQACVEGGAHYADLSGEMQFVRRTIDEFDAAARAAGIKLVQPCGFESLPPDLAVRLAAETARDRWGEHLDSVDLVDHPASSLPARGFLPSGSKSLPISSARMGVDDGREGCWEAVGDLARGPARAGADCARIEL